MQTIINPEKFSCPAYEPNKSYDFARYIDAKHISDITKRATNDLNAIAEAIRERGGKMYLYTQTGVKLEVDSDLLCVTMHT